MNSYEPENVLQKAWDSCTGLCLCGHGEWCSNCSGSNESITKAVAEIARSVGYQLYLRPGFGINERRPLNYDYYLGATNEQ